MGIYYASFRLDVCIQRSWNSLSGCNLHFNLPQPIQSSDFAKKLGCEYNSLGGISVDSYGRTNVQGVYAAGDASVFAPAQLIIAAADGLKAAAGVNRDLIQKEFLE